MGNALETRLNTLKELETELDAVRTHLGRAVVLAQQVESQCVTNGEGNGLHVSWLVGFVDAANVGFLARLAHTKPHLTRLRNRIKSKLLNEL